MKRSTIALSALLLILIAAAFLYFNSESEPDNIFHLEDSSIVTEIEMEKVVRGEKLEEDQTDQKG